MIKLLVFAALFVSFSARADGPAKAVGKITKTHLIELENCELKIEKVVNQANEQIKPIIAPFVARRSEIYKEYAIIDGDKYDADGTIHHAKDSPVKPSAAASPKAAVKPKAPVPASAPLIEKKK